MIGKSKKQPIEVRKKAKKQKNKRKKKLATVQSGAKVRV